MEQKNRDPNADHDALTRKCEGAKPSRANASAEPDSRAIWESLDADRSRAARDAVIYLVGGKVALAAEHERRNLDKRATSRAVGAVAAKLRAHGLGGHFQGRREARLRRAVAAAGKAGA